MGGIEKGPGKEKQCSPLLLVWDLVLQTICMNVQLTLEVGVGGGDLECCSPAPTPRSGKSTYNLQLVLSIHTSASLDSTSQGLRVVYFFKFYLFMFGCTGSLLLLLWSYSLAAAHGLLTVVASPVAEHGFWGGGLQLLQHLGSVVAAYSSSRRGFQQSWHTHLADPWHVGSSWSRNQTLVPCIGRWISNHWTTREV